MRHYVRFLQIESHIKQISFDTVIIAKAYHSLCYLFIRILMSVVYDYGIFILMFLQYDIYLTIHVM